PNFTPRALLRAKTGSGAAADETGTDPNRPSHDKLCIGSLMRLKPFVACPQCAARQTPRRGLRHMLRLHGQPVIRRKPAVRSSRSRSHGGTCRILAGYRSLPTRDTVGHINRIHRIRTVVRHAIGAAGSPQTTVVRLPGGGLSKHRAFPIGCEMKTPRLLQGRRGPVLSVLLLLLIAACAAYWQLRPTAPSTPATGAAASMLEALQDSTEPWQANRRDLSVLMADLRDATIASAALGKDAVYVSLSDGLHYWIPDQSGHVARLLLEQYAQSGGELFPLTMFQTDAEKPFYRFLLPYSPIALLLIGAAL